MTDLTQPVQVRGMTSRPMYRGVCPDCGWTTQPYNNRSTAELIIREHWNEGRCTKTGTS